MLKSSGFSVIFGLFILVSMSACDKGSKGIRLSADAYCKKRDDPVALKIKSKAVRKLKLGSKPSPDDTEFKTGTYVFQSATMFYQLPTEDVKVRAEHFKDQKGDWKTKPGCARGFDPKTKLQPMTVNGITKFVVDEGKNIKPLEVGSFSMGFDRGDWIPMDFERRNLSAPEQAKPVADYFISNYQMFSIPTGKRKPNTLELRSHGKLTAPTEGELVGLAVRFKYCDPAIEMAKRSADCKE